MPSTITGLSLNNAFMTEQYLLDKANGVHRPGDAYKLVLLNLANGNVTITQAGTKKYADISAAEAVSTGGTDTYVAGGIPLSAPVVAVSARRCTVGFTISDGLTNTSIVTDAWAIINETATAANGRAGTNNQDKPILAIGKWNGPKSPVLGALTLTIDADTISETCAAPA